MEFLKSTTDRNPTNVLKQVEFNALPDSIEMIEQEGFKLFSLGPLYVYGGVTESITERFASEAKEDLKIEAGQVHFDNIVVARCEKWNYCLDFMSKEAYEYFQQWMLGQIFMKRQDADIVVPRKFLAPVIDPLAALKGKEVHTVLDVYTTSSMKKLLRPKCEVAPGNAPRYIDFEYKPPEAEVIKLGGEILPLVDA